jgi:hypothetical protein
MLPIRKRRAWNRDPRRTHGWRLGQDGAQYDGSQKN